jgi:hypothetical protein
MAPEEGRTTILAQELEEFGGGMCLCLFVLKLLKELAMALT